MKMKHCYSIEIIPTAEECEKMSEVGEMLYHIQDEMGHDDSLIFESIDSGEYLDYYDLARVRGVLDALQNHRGWKVMRKGD